MENGKHSTFSLLFLFRLYVGFQNDFIYAREKNKAWRIKVSLSKTICKMKRKGKKETKQGKLESKNVFGIFESQKL